MTSSESTTTGLIASHRSALEAELVRLATRIEEIKQELSELDMAARVIARLSGSPIPEVYSAKLRGPSPAKLMPVKPDGIPTMPEMITAVLSENSYRGMSPKDIMAEIARRWWPAVSSEYVGPIAWRMWKQGRLEKDGAVYALPRQIQELM